MNVSELARHVGIAPSAVRFYERKGVLPTAARTENGYRDYTDDDLCRLRLVVGLRSLGLDLAVAGRLAHLCQSGQCDAMSRDLAPLVDRQRAAIRDARRRLDDLDRQLASVAETLAAGDPEADLCISARGGEIDDDLLRPGMPVSAGTRLPVLNGLS